MDENKSMSLAVLGVVGVIAVVSVVLLLTNSQTAQVSSGLDKYTSQRLEGDPGRYYEVTADRLVNGKIYGVGIEQAQQEGTPFRTYKRAQSEIASLQTSCPIGFTPVKDLNLIKSIENKYGVECIVLNGGNDNLNCCPNVNRGEGPQ